MSGPPVPKRRSVETGRRLRRAEGGTCTPTRCVVMTGPSLQDPTACQSRSPSPRRVSTLQAGVLSGEMPVTAQIVSVPPVSWT
jgi:hypothetical protein